MSKTDELVVHFDNQIFNVSAKETVIRGIDGKDGKDGKDGQDGAPGADGVSPEVGITSVTGGHAVTITDRDHPQGQSFNVLDGEKGDDGDPGQDGVSPEVSIDSITGGHTVTITDADHPSGQSFNVMDGADGQDGAPGTDGVSPAVTVTPITGGNSVTITDKTHPGGQSFNVLNGQDGAPGAAGPTGPPGIAVQATAPTTDVLAWLDTDDDSTVTLAETSDLVPIQNNLTQLKTDTFGTINLTGTNNTDSTITAGTFFYNNGILVRAKTDIQNGSTITIGTNAETVTAGGLNDLAKTSIKTLSSSGTSSQYSHIDTTLPITKKLIAIALPSSSASAIPFMGSGYWAFRVIESSNMTPIPNITVSYTMYYLD